VLEADGPAPRGHRCGRVTTELVAVEDRRDPAGPRHDAVEEPVLRAVTRFVLGEVGPPSGQ
jgi:hypothetical protein